MKNTLKNLINGKYKKQKRQWNQKIKTEVKIKKKLWKPYFRRVISGKCEEYKLAAKNTVYLRKKWKHAVEQIKILFIKSLKIQKRETIANKTLELQE